MIGHILSWVILFSFTDLSGIITLQTEKIIH